MNNPICHCVFIKKTTVGFEIIAVYVHDLNLIGIPQQLIKTTNCLKKFEIKDIRKTKYCLHLQIEYVQMVSLSTNQHIQKMY